MQTKEQKRIEANIEAAEEIEFVETSVEEALAKKMHNNKTLVGF